MAYTTINKSTEHFNTKLYTGNGSTQSITGVGFQPDFTWVKNRDTAAWHTLVDVVRGVTKTQYTNRGDAQGTYSSSINAFNSDGFTVGNSGDVNNNGSNLVAWNWKGSGTTANDTTSGYLANTQTVNETAGFTCLKYTGTGTNTVTNTGLSTPLDVSITKRIDASGDWYVYHRYSGGTAGQAYFWLNSQSNRLSSSTIFQNIAPQMDGSISYQAMGASSPINISGAEYISYGWSARQGYSKFGSYVGNGNANGPMIYTGLKPAFILYKNASTNENWEIHDTKRNPSNLSNKIFYANQNSAEATTDRIDILSNGFKPRTTNSSCNTNGDTYIYMAFGQSLVGSNGVTAKAR